MDDVEIIDENSRQKTQAVTFAKMSDHSKSSYIQYLK